MNPLLRYWPRQPAGSSIINADADVIQDLSVVLATHQRTRFVKRTVSTVAGRGAGDPVLIEEEDFLSYFLEDRDNYLLAPVTGKSGIGKSHMIVWLEAQLQRRPDRDTRHIIRIPKGSSFRGVINKILDQLEGEPYARLRERISGAKNQLSADDAREHLRACLNNALRRIYTQNHERLQQTTDALQRRALQEEAIHADGLQALMDDNFFKREHFFVSGGPIDRIARRAVEGGTRSEDATALQFRTEDLRLTPQLSARVEKEASDLAKKYYIGRLEGEGDRKQDYRKKAAAVLNKAIDEALPQLWNIGDNELIEILCETRVQLQRDNKELVFLVEDFSVLAGLQGTLLDAMTIPRQRSGQDLMCLMRTAMAVTDGYIAQWDTIATRAQYEFIIQPEPADDESLIEFVGAYLNAERYGLASLNARYANHGADSHSWLPVFCEDLDREALDAFGYSRGRVPLFPFNRHAILEILKLRLQEDADGRLTFHPRTVVNAVLVDVFQKLQPSFLDGRFPPPSFELYQRSRIRDELGSAVERQMLGTSRDDLDRVAVLLRFWGGNPRDLDAARRLDARIYHYFKLPAVPGAERSSLPPPGPADPDPPRQPDPRPPTPPEPRPPRVQDPKPPQPPKPPVSPEDQKIELWDGLLERWRNGEKLPSDQANQMRRWILDLVLHTVDWEAEPIRVPFDTIKTRHKWVWLANAVGGPTAATAIINIHGPSPMPENALPDRDLVIALKGLARFEVRQWSWDFAESYLYYAPLMAAVDRWRESFLQWYRSRTDLVPSLVHLLAFQSTLAGQSVDSSATSIEYLFAEAPPAAGGVEDWQFVYNRLCEAHPKLQRLLLDLAGFFQGGPLTARENQQLLAVDAYRLLPPLQKVDALAPPPLHSLPQQDEYRDIRALIETLQERWGSAVGAQTRWLQDTARTALPLLPAGTDFPDLLNRLRNTLLLAQDLGLRPDTRRHLQESITSVENVDLAAARDDLERSSSALQARKPRALVDVARASSPAVQALSRLTGHASSLLEEGQRKTAIDASSGAAARKCREDIAAELDGFCNWTLPTSREAT